MNTIEFPSNEEYLKRLLNLYWLRPETALLRAEDCAFVRDYCADIMRSGENLEMGCGNGLLSFIMGGGVIDKNYDVFMDVDSPELYSTTSKDIFDKETNRVLDFDDTGLMYHYETAVDWKAGLLNQAGRFKSLYKSLVQADLNNPITLEHEYDNIFCNMLYWLKDPLAVLKNWHDLLKAGGHIILFCTNEQFVEKAWLYYKMPHKGFLAYLNYFDRGYGEQTFNFISDHEWKQVFNAAGYKVEEMCNARTDAMMQIFNIGMRPIFSPLMVLVEKLSMEDRLSAKEFWVKYFYDFLAPVLEDSIAKRKLEKGAYNFYILQRK